MINNLNLKTMKKLFFILLLAGNAYSQWKPIAGFQIDETPNYYSYYTSDRSDAISKCKQVLEYNNVNLATINVDKTHDPIVNSHLYKEEQPDMVYMVYIAKTSTGYAVRLVFTKNEYFEIEEEYMTIVYEK
jgi:hypothetical protein